MRRHRQCAEFIEEERATIGFLEPAGARAVGAGEGALFMAEQLCLDQGFGQRRAIHGDERFAPAWGEVMQAFGDQFLAGAAFTDDQHRAIELGSAPGLLHRIEKGEALADKLRIFLHAPTYGEISHPLARGIPPALD